MAPDVERLVDEIRVACRAREDFHRAEKRLTLQAKALARRAAHGVRCEGRECRRILCAEDKKDAALYEKAIDESKAPAFDHPRVASFVVVAAPILEARDGLMARRLEQERALKSMVRELPVWSEWAKDVPGLGELGVGLIVGEAGDLRRYASPSRLWKRMGLAVSGGVIQRNLRRKGMSEEEARRVAYSTRRRAVIHVVGVAIEKMRDAPLKRLYLERKQYERERAVRNGIKTGPEASLTAAKRRGEPCLSDGRIRFRALRYIEKRVLRDLWVAWHATT